MMFKSWSVSRRVAFVVLVIAVLDALVFGFAGLAISLLVLLVVCTAGDLAWSKFKDRRTSARVGWAVLVLLGIWLVLYLSLVPAISALMEDHPDTPVVEDLAALLKPLTDLDSCRQTYLALAVSVPLLLFVFGAGPCSQHGSMAAPADDDAPAADGNASAAGSEEAE